MENNYPEKIRALGKLEAYQDDIEKISKLLPESEQLRLDITTIRQRLYKSRGKVKPR